MLSIPFLLSAFEEKWVGKSVKVSIYPCWLVACWVLTLQVMFDGIYVQQAIGKAEKCLVGCQVTNTYVIIASCNV